MENSLESTRILDAACGTRSIWYQKEHPFVTFMDKRREKLILMSKNCKLKDRRNIEINPDVIADWKNPPFQDDYFDMIVFDPPHKIAKQGSEKCGMEILYGRLFSHNWRQELKEGINKLFSILKPNGIFILKWCEVDKPVKEVLALFPYPPLFGTRVGQANKTHWIVFLKHRLNKTVEI